MSLRSHGSVAVLGGSGFIGQAVCQQLMSTGRDVVAVGRVNAATGPSHACELDDLDELAAVLPEFESVICLAPSSLPATSNSDLGCEVREHVALAIDIAEVAASAGVQRFVFSSSGGTVYGPSSTSPDRESALPRPICGYGVSKVAIEGYLRVLANQSEMKCLSLRISNPFGPSQMSNTGHGFVGAAVAAALNGGPLTIWGDGSTVRDFIAVQDVARAFEAAIAYDGSCTEFNIGTGHGTSLNETVLAVERAFSASVNVRRAEARSVDVPYSVLDISLAKDHLHWKPELTLDSALQMWGSEVGS